ncbi:hypothetical protein DCCM_4057 [Desulfocucumis palustris]|uniref:Uncharacterized protein n=1 Tax=Desulfocucumis palustris TaxID=1898651 RepID=A0A2L2XF12_9FIRM|nr:hypothetical protein DCCM_4057 [Desulfocucumis palustris]
MQSVGGIKAKGGINYRLTPDEQSDKIITPGGKRRGSAGERIRQE